MSAAAHLPLYEEILLLALDDDKGTTALGDLFATAMGGAMLAELAMLGAARIGKDKQNSVTAVKGTRVDDPCWPSASTPSPRRRRRRTRRTGCGSSRG